jgi:ADP-heptose:LPS heptosyltransferase
MMTPSAAADSILAWFANRPLAAVAPELAALPADHAVLTAADIIADAADSDDEALRSAGLGALFGGLVEPLNDGFTPAGRAVYARVFGHIVWRVAARQPALLAALAESGITSEAQLIARHAVVRSEAVAPRARALPDTVQTVVVLSRVTIGADILISSQALVAARARWPQARVVLIGDGKLGGLFNGLPGVTVQALSYARRGPLRDRLAAWLPLRTALADLKPDVVIAPDSRLDQLGILPVPVADDRYLLWENLQPEGDVARSLAERYGAWLAGTLGVSAPKPVVELDVAAAAQRDRFAAAFGPGPLCAVKLDHGGNPAKALPRAGEIALLRHLRAQGWRILLDRGFGADELANSDALLADLGWQAVDLDDSGKGLGLVAGQLAPGQCADAAVIRFHGSIAGWASSLACCRLALSYDSVGHHLAAALGVPVVVAFTGYADPAFPIAWQPRGSVPATVVAIPTEQKADSAQWERVAAAFPAP